LLLILGGWGGWLLILRGRNKRTAEKQKRAAGQREGCRFAESALSAASAGGDADGSFHGKSPQSDELLGGVRN
jgi:hypothetical protein